MDLELRPYEGAAPLLFGCSRAAVAAILGPPRIRGRADDSWGEKLELIVGYDSDGMLNHIGVGPGAFGVVFVDIPIWTTDSIQDPNAVFLKFDADPVESLGFLIFSKLGIATTGFHDDDRSQRAIILFPRGSWVDEALHAGKPVLSRYA